MSMTPASSQYFSRVADQWDTLRSGYFTDAVREAAIRKAYLRPEMVVADVGSGTGFVAAGLAPLVQKVYVLDGSPEMLEVARRNLEGFTNLEFRQADGLSLPLPDGSLDAIFANMYLHHIVDPLEAIQEMVRVLKPGGRLVISDMDSHPYTWLKEEMADVWMGFERQQIRNWFEDAGLVNRNVESSGETCSSVSEKEELYPEDERRADIHIFVASGTKRIRGVREAVQADYSVTALGGSGCCSPQSETGASESAASCCSPGSAELISMDNISVDGIQWDTGYSAEERAVVPQESAEISLGCGNPLALAGLQPGEVVLDIGSGGGMDAFLAASKVGPSGKVIGVDMTPAMLERARRSAEKAGLEHVEFRYGLAEALPVQDGEVDVILSNCVINLTEDKGKVFAEAYRVLREGGRLEVSDMVTDRAYPLELLQHPEGWSGCVYGALPETEYLDLVREAGFKEVTTKRSASAGVSGDVRAYSVIVSARK